MKTQHTAEPWVIAQTSQVDTSLLVRGTDPEAKWKRSTQMDTADAKRIVECVNACAGISDPAAALQAAREALMGIIGHYSERDWRDLDYIENGRAAGEYSVADAKAARRALELLGGGK